MDNREFFEKIYKENVRFIRAVALDRLYRKDDIADCLQDIFLTALNKPSIREHPNITGWLCETAKNLVLQYNDRAMKAKLGREILEADLVVEDFSDVLIEEILYDEAVSKDAVRKVIASLSYRDKDLYHLRYEKGLTYKEISEILGRTEKAIWTQSSRLKEKISKLLKNFLEKV